MPDIDYQAQEVAVAASLRGKNIVDAAPSREAVRLALISLNDIAKAGDDRAERVTHIKKRRAYLRHLDHLLGAPKPFDQSTADDICESLVEVEKDLPAGEGSRARAVVRRAANWVRAAGDHLDPFPPGRGPEWTPAGDDDAD